MLLAIIDQALAIIHRDQPWLVIGWATDGETSLGNNH